MNTRDDFMRSLLQKARTAGMKGLPLPDFGTAFQNSELRQINDAYNDARNEHAAGKHKKDD